MTVRSAVLGRWHSVAGQNHVALTVPAGMTVIIKSFVANNRSGQTARIVVSVFPAGASGNVDFVNVAPTASFDPVHWDGWVVATENDRIQFYCDQAGVDMQLSGTLLQGIAVFPPGAQQLPALPSTPPNFVETPPISLPLPNVSGA